MLHQGEQGFRSHDRTGLQELAQLMDLDALVQLLEPVVGLLDDLLAGSFDLRGEIGRSLRLKGKFASQFEVKGIETAGIIPLGGKVLHRCRGRHDFTIQLGTSLRKRAAMMVLPGKYCTATTEASKSSDPSELRRRRTSANSRGVSQAKRTSRGVPNSTMVLSVKLAGAGSPACRVRAN